MFHKISRCFLIPFLSFTIVCTSGFCIWIFFDDVKKNGTMNGKILLEAKYEYGNVTFVSSKNLDYEEYRIVFEHGDSSEVYDETKGINLVPSLVFDFSDYHPDGKLEKPSTMEGYSFYYYVDFNNTGTIYNESGYGQYMTGELGQSLSTKKPIDVDWTSSSTRVSFSPVFHYRKGKKPTTSARYQKMLDDIYKDEGISTFTVHILLEKE